MKVVVAPTGFGDTSVERAVLEPAGWHVEEVEGPNPDDLYVAAGDADALLVQYTRLDAAVLERLPRLRVISRYGVGVDNIDLHSARARGITVCNVPVYGGAEVALHATTLVLASLRRLTELTEAVSRGGWDHTAAGRLPSPDQATLGVLGLGRIGRVVASRAGCWFGRVIAHDPQPQHVPPGIDLVGLDELFAASDVVSLHAPLTAATQGVVDRRRLRLLGPGGVLVNTARGGLVVLDDLLAAVEAGELGRAALDVLPDEPPATDHPVRGHPRILVTPHAAWYSTAAEEDLRRRAANNVVAWETGSPTNVVV